MKEDGGELIVRAIQNLAINLREKAERWANTNSICYNTIVVIADVVDAVAETAEEIMKEDEDKS